jgi:hypothetical protein
MPRADAAAHGVGYGNANRRQATMDGTLRKAMSSLILESVLTCPNCGHQREEVMPTDACQYFYECTSCKTMLKPKSGDCCVFCSYGSVACPPIQEQRGCCH